MPEKIYEKHAILRYSVPSAMTSALSEKMLIKNGAAKNTMKTAGTEITIHMV